MKLSTAQSLGPAMLQIEVPVCDLNGFKCVETSVSHRYKYKHLKTALSNIPQRDPAAVNSKVGNTIRSGPLAAQSAGCKWVQCWGCISAASLLRAAGQRSASFSAQGCSPLHRCHRCCMEGWQRRGSGLQKQASLHHTVVFVITQPGGLLRHPCCQTQLRAGAAGRGEHAAISLLMQSEDHARRRFAWGSHM